MSQAWEIGLQAWFGMRSEFRLIGMRLAPKVWELVGIQDYDGNTWAPPVSQYLNSIHFKSRVIFPDGIPWPSFLPSVAILTIIFHLKTRQSTMHRLETLHETHCTGAKIFCRCTMKYRYSLNICDASPAEWNKLLIIHEGMCGSKGYHGFWTTLIQNRVRFVCS